MSHDIAQANESSHCSHNVTAVTYKVAPKRNTYKIVTSIPYPSTELIGRVQEIKAIETAFSSGQHAVFLHGEGGIGKSTLAIAYGNRHLKDYDSVVFLRYRNSLKDLLSEIKYENCESAQYEPEQMDRSALSESVLLIIDNFDVEVDADQYLDTFLQFRADMLFTTRTDFSDVLGGSNQQIEIQNLKHADILEVFYRKSRRMASSDTEQELTLNLLRLVDYNTYAAEILGLQMHSSGLSIGQLYAKMKKGLSGFIGAEKIRTNKDGQFVKRSMLEIFRALYQISDLIEDRQNVLRLLYLLRFLRVDRDLYKWFDASTDALNDLVELGWVRQDGRYFVYYSLHPLVEALVLLDLKPNAENCPAFFSFLDYRIRDTLNYDLDSEASQAAFDRSCEVLCALLAGLDYSFADARKLALHWLMGLQDLDDEKGWDPEDIGFKKVYAKLLDSIDHADCSPEETFQIYFLLLNAWSSRFWSFYTDSSAQQRFDAIRINEYQKYFTLASKAAQFLPDDQMESALDQVYATLYPLLRGIDGTAFPKEKLIGLYLKRPQAIDLDFREKEEIGIPLTEEELQQEAAFYEHTPVFAPGYTDDKIEEESACKHGFFASNDKVGYVLAIAEDRSKNLPKRAELIFYCTDSIFSRITMLPFHRDVPINWDWHMCERILDIEGDLLMSDKWDAIRDPSHIDIVQDWEYYLTQNTENQVITYAALGDIESFEATLSILLTAVEQDVKHAIGHGSHWTHHVSLKSYDSMSLYHIKNGLINIKKIAWLVPTLLTIVEQWEEYAQTRNDFEEEDLFPLYQEIVNCVTFAMDEKETPEHFKLDYWKIQDKYESKMEAITDPGIQIDPDFYKS